LFPAGFFTMQADEDRKNPDTGKRLLAIKSAADHAARAHKGQFRKDRRTPYIIHPARVAALVGMSGGTHVAIIAAWLHDIYEDCSPEWIAQTEEFIASLPFSDDERNDIAAIVDALTKKNTIRGKTGRLSDSIGRILDAPPEATLVKICDRIDNFLDSSLRGGQFRKRYLASTDEIIERLSTRAELYGYNKALATLEEIRTSTEKKD
jgi:(p)ppGpp synthase/HD superfamily hydrolase